MLSHSFIWSIVGVDEFRCIVCENLVVGCEFGFRGTQKIDKEIGGLKLLKACAFVAAGTWHLLEPTPLYWKDWCQSSPGKCLELRACPELYVARAKTKLILHIIDGPKLLLHSCVSWSRSSMFAIPNLCIAQRAHICLHCTTCPHLLALPNTFCSNWEANVQCAIGKSCSQSPKHF